MRLNLCIASRGHPIDLIKVIEETDKSIADPSRVTISVALDDDDESNPRPPKTRSQLIWSIDKREDSLGEKYNRAAYLAPSDVYVLGADDNIFMTDGWDEKIRHTMGMFPDNFGFVYFGRLDGTLPTQMAIPHQLVEDQGFLFPPHWPFWFHDTWTDEIAHRTGRILWTDIAVEEIGGRGNTRGLRDVVFWTNLFEALRPKREEIGVRLSKKFNEPWFEQQLQQRRDILATFFQMRTLRLRNPATAIQFERRMSYDSKPTERYTRIKAKAEILLTNMRSVAA